MDDSWTPFDDDADDRDERDARDRDPFDVVFDLLSDRFDVDDDDFDGSFHFEVHTGTGGAGGVGADGPTDADPRRRGMGPASRRGHPRFDGPPGPGPGRDPDRVGRAAAAADPEADADDAEIEYELRPGDDTTELLADLAGTGAVDVDVSASVVAGDLVVATDGTTLFDAPLPEPGEVREVVEHNGILRVTVDHGDA